MTRSTTLNVAVVGLQFGADFVPIYRRHPDVGRVVVCDTDRARMAEVAARHPGTEPAGSLEQILADPGIDAVHLLTPVPLHVPQTLAVLGAGKHCACAVPMGLTLEELSTVVDATRRSGRNYMMMETAVYTREYLFVRDLICDGELGRVSFARGSHLQDTVGYADYWRGFPPHLYMTHAVSPVLGLLDATAARVHCLGSGTLPAEWQSRWQNPYPVETAIFRLRRSDVAVEITRSLFQVARSFVESFAVYGERRGFEWQQLENEDPALFTLLPPRTGQRVTPVVAERVRVPDTASRLPAEIAGFTRPRNVSTDPSRPRMVGGGHGGSHPHLVNEFVRSIVEGRPSAVNELVSANWTAPGICAHASAMTEGAAVDIPLYGPG